ncbi:MAG TPA: class I SAM-dependent methyltransferase [Patescibacteria group bacterium]|nr:class I SAM-dependent methyltransferase [Patescibacteria group bacterium]
MAGEFTKLIPWLHRIPEPRDKLETAEQYIKMAENFRKSDEDLADTLAEKIPYGATVAEIGFGPWNTGLYLLQKRPDLTYIGYDYDEEMILHAKKKAEVNGFTEEKVRFMHADMTTMANTYKGPADLYVFSNTVIHERPDDPEGKLLRNTLNWMSHMVGRYGGCYLRDLRRASSEEEAKQWRNQIVQDEDLDKDQLQLFKQSQLAADTPQELWRAINETPLIAKGGRIIIPKAPNERYWIYEIAAPSSRLRRTIKRAA